MTRIMVVDDEMDTLDVLRLFLELSGYEPITTFNSAEAITLAEAERPDCVLLDVMMPGINGFALCKMMRSHPTTKNLPIMFVTAYSPMDIEERRIEAGADMVLPKPFGMDGLISAVEQVMALRAKIVTQGIDDKTQVVSKNASAEAFAAALQHIVAHKPQDTAYLL